MSNPSRATPPGAESPEQVIARYEAALAFLQDKGLRMVGRFKKCQHVVTKYRKRGEAPLDVLPQAFLDLYQLARVVECLGHRRDDVFLGKLKLLVSDHQDPRIGKSSLGRDTQSELFLAAELAARGIDVSIEEPDLIAHIGWYHFGIAVKRPKALGTLRRNIKKAARQLWREGFGEPSITHGLLAIDVTFLANEEGRAVVDPDLPAGAESADRMLVGPVADYLESTDLMSGLLHKLDSDHVRLCSAVVLVGAVTQLEKSGGVINSVAFRTIHLGGHFAEALGEFSRAVRCS